LTAVPAANAVDVQQPPTGVQVGWTMVPTADGPIRGVQLMWQEADPAATYEWSMERFDGAQWVGGTFTPATARGSVSVPSRDFPYRATVRMVVRAVAAGVASVPVASPAFDTHGALPTLTSAVGSADGSVRLTWTPQLLPDSTPNYPLDLVAPTVYQLVGKFRPQERLDAIGAVTNRLTVQHTPQGPGRLGVAPDNEWRPVEDCCGLGRFVPEFPTVAAVTNVWTTGLSAGVTPVATYSLPLAVTGKVTRRLGSCGHLDCSIGTSPDVGRRVALQARNNSTGAPWYGVTSTTTVADGSFRISLPAPGSREYRVLALGTTWRPGVVVPVKAGTLNGPMGNVVVSRVVTSRFVDASATVGQRVTASLQVLPAGTQRTTLQRWTGSSWVGVKWVQLAGGVGSYTFTTVRPGTVAYRFAIPASVAPNGLTVAARFGPNFSLTTR
jgi:hypothetical protein